MVYSLVKLRAAVTFQQLVGTAWPTTKALQGFSSVSQVLLCKNSKKYCSVKTIKSAYRIHSGSCWKPVSEEHLFTILTRILFVYYYL
jgi:hypothetical protein